MLLPLLRVFVLLLLSCCAAVLELLAARPKVNRRNPQTGQNLWGGGYRSSCLACGAVGVRRSPAENADATDPPPRPLRSAPSAGRYHGALTGIHRKWPLHYDGPNFSEPALALRAQAPRWGKTRQRSVSPLHHRAQSRLRNLKGEVKK